MACRYPGNACIEWIKQRCVAFTARLLEAHLERRTHHETLELRFHDSIGAAGAGQAQIVAVLCGQFEDFTLKNFFAISRYFAVSSGVVTWPPMWA